MVQSFISITFILMITIIFMSGSCRKIENDEVLMSRESSMTLKGLAILYVFTHHYWQLTLDIYNTHTFIGYVGVTIFLTVAGYVSQKQLKNKGMVSLSYKFFIKKFIRLYIPYISIKAFLAMWQRKTLYDLIVGIVHIEDDWFLCAITIFYILFFVTSKLCYGKHNYLMLLGIVLYIICCGIIGLPPVWYNTSLAFYIGMAGAEDKGKQFLKLNNIEIIAGVGTLIFGIMTALRWFVLGVISTLFSVSLGILVICYMNRFRTYNKILHWIGNISWEFYLFQSSILVILGKVISNNYLVYFISGLTMSIVLGYVISNAIGILLKKSKLDKLFYYIL